MRALSRNGPLVGILVDHERRLAAAAEAAGVLAGLGVPHEVVLACAAATPHRVSEYALRAEERGIRVLIAIGHADLGRALAVHTLLPVVAVPPARGGLAGLGALLAALAGPEGFPLATVAGGAPAALLAARVLAVGDPGLRRRLAELRIRLAERVHEANRRLQAARRAGPAPEPAAAAHWEVAREPAADAGAAAGGEGGREEWDPA